MTAPDRVWTEINARPPRIRRPFGAALSPEQRGEIVKPMLITEPTKRITLPELRKMMESEK